MRTKWNRSILNALRLNQKRVSLLLADHNLSTRPHSLINLKLSVLPGTFNEGVTKQYFIIFDRNPKVKVTAESRFGVKLTGAIKSNLVTRTLLAFLSLGIISPWLWGQDIRLPTSITVPAHVIVGSGKGVITTSSNAVVTLEGTAETFGDYAENTKQKATVFDYLLPKALPLPEGANRIGLQYQNASLDGNVMLRVLIEDKRGGVWAVGTRLGGGASRANSTKGLARLETYAFDTSELGRIDPLVMMALDPAKFDEYNPPQAPFRLAGFRLVLEGGAGKASVLQIQNLRALSPNQMADPYWALVPEKAWEVRVPNAFAQQRTGWGPETPTPGLTASDLNLSRGTYLLNWEVLNLQQWRVLTSGSERVSVTSDLGARMIEFPLLPAGTYHLRIAARKDEEKAFRESFLTYVVVRNSKATAVVKNPGEKPLRFEAANEGIFDSPQHANVKIACAPGALIDGEGVITWTLEAVDGRVLKQGKDDAREGAIIDLNEPEKQEEALWITARLSVAGEERDVARRIVGIRSVAPKTGKLESVPNAKLDILSGQFIRTKGDWSEGGTAVASNSARVLTNYGPWIDEANEIGYNSVELAASWWDLNPLPGIYQFDYLDKLIALAKERKTRVVLRVHPSPGNVPLWVAREFQTDQTGSIDGLWGGGGTNLIYTPSSMALRKALNTYLEALASHYRDDPSVIGYTLSSVFFDHDLLDMPWEGQTVDYSEASRQGFIASLRDRYQDDLAAVRTAHGKAYSAWQDIAIPLPKPAFDLEGRLMPRTDVLWKEWMDFKIDTTRIFRISGAEALRRGDPGCWVGLYSSDITPFSTERLTNGHFSLACGAMEFQFPEPQKPLPSRFEPSGKVARTAKLVDVGLSNMLLSAPADYYSFFNYWMEDWRLATVEPSVRQAEERLHRWFSVTDRLVGAKAVEDAGAQKHRGVYLSSLDIFSSILQEAFTPRLDDFLKPYLFRVSADKTQVDSMLISSGIPLDLSDRPYTYVPYSTTVIDQTAGNALADYVKKGGKLVLEATSGFWSTDGKTANLLPGLLGLPEASPIKTLPPSAAEVANWRKGSGFEKVRMAFRVKPFEPPVDDQPTGWIHNIPGSFLRAFRVDPTKIGKAEVLADFSDGSPAVLHLRYGKGEVLYFCGTVDWLSCPRLSDAIDQWGMSSGSFSFVVRDAKFPDLLSQVLRNGNRTFVVGRRFISGNELGELGGGKHQASLDANKDISVPIPAATAVSYHVRDVLNGKDFGTIPAGQLPREGVALKLTPGQAFILEADPVR